jgi:hypothetical protein
MNASGKMTYNELKTWLRDRLQMRGVAAADVSMLRDEAPYEQPLTLWKSGGDEFRNDFKRAVLDLVSEAGTQPWEPESFNELSRLVEEADLWEATRPLEEAIHSQRLFEGSHGAQLHMLVLRTLLALGWAGTPDFWHSEKNLIGSQWPGVIFQGLARQDIGLAFGSLPELATKRQAVRQVLDYFPILVRDLGISTLHKHSCDIVGKLSPEAAQALRDWFRLRNCPLLAAGGIRVNGGLRSALVKTLGGDSEPRFLSPMLLGASETACAPA